MIRTWLSLVPADRRGNVIAYTVLALVSVVARAVATVLLVPWWLRCSATHRNARWYGWAGLPRRR